MIKLNNIRTFGDCMSLFQVSLDKDITIREFIDEVLTKNEWGFIYVNDIKIIHDCEYRQNMLITELPPNVLDYKIEKITADGGWTRMDYTITPK